MGPGIGKAQLANFLENWSPVAPYEFPPMHVAFSNSVCLCEVQARIYTRTQSDASGAGRDLS